MYMKTEKIVLFLVFVIITCFLFYLFFNGNIIEGDRGYGGDSGDGGDGGYGGYGGDSGYGGG